MKTLGGCAAVAVALLVLCGSVQAGGKHEGSKGKRDAQKSRREEPRARRDGGGLRETRTGPLSTGKNKGSDLAAWRTGPGGGQENLKCGHTDTVKQRPQPPEVRVIPPSPKKGDGDPVVKRRPPVAPPAEPPRAHLFPDSRGEHDRDGGGHDRDGDGYGRGGHDDRDVRDDRRGGDDRHWGYDRHDDHHSWWRRPAPWWAYRPTVFYVPRTHYFVTEFVFSDSILFHEECCCYCAPLVCWHWAAPCGDCGRLEEWSPICGVFLYPPRPVLGFYFGATW